MCAPTRTACTAYSYGTGSHYRSAVLDSGPRSYWQLGDASGATTATDEVDANLGTTNGTYSNVTLGAAGPLAGSSETAASFNGSSSSVALPEQPDHRRHRCARSSCGSRPPVRPPAASCSPTTPTR